jgi:hypothetical protein
MKKLSLVSFAILVSFCVYGKFTYDPSKGTIVDEVNGWEFNATLKNTDELYLDGTGCSYPDSSPCSLDLTKITDANGKTYKAVSFKALPVAARPYLTEFIAPDCQKIEGENCFNSCTELLKVELNENVTYIGAFAFYKCSKLENFTPRTLNVSYLYGSTFRECTSLAGSFDMPNCIKIVGMAFLNCAKIESVSAANVTDVGESSFSGCSRLSNVSFPKITSIANSAFSRCASLSNESLDGLLHKNIKQLGSNAIDNQEWLFSECSAITGPVVWDFPSLTTNVVAKGMFNNCTSLKEVRFVTDVARIKDWAFRDIASGASIYMPLTAPAVYGERAVSRSSGNYPKVYLKGNHDEWLDVMRQHHSVILKEDFNNSDKWVLNGSIATKEKVRDAMIADGTMCGEAENKTIRTVDRNIIAFVAYYGNEKQTGFCWVLKMPKTGLRMILR